MTQFLDLAEWMAAERLKDRHLAGDIARETGQPCSKFAVKKWRLKLRVPRPTYMKAIMKLSGGKVTADSFYRSGAEPSQHETVGELSP